MRFWACQVVSIDPGLEPLYSARTLKKVCRSVMGKPVTVWGAPVPVTVPPTERQKASGPSEDVDSSW